MLDLQASIPVSWQAPLAAYFRTDAYAMLQQHLDHLYKEKEGAILPPSDQVLQALCTTNFDAIKVVIIGQDPYHRPGQAMGLSFSVPKGVRIPPSLRNIYRELYNDVGCIPSLHGDLTYWAQQGVLLLNTILTVEQGNPGSHRKIGWQSFTDAIIHSISRRQQGVIFLLWGNFAKKKAELIDHSRHHVLEAAHPSPLARGAFYGCKHFSQANLLLKAQAKKEIEWTLP